MRFGNYPSVALLVAYLISITTVAALFDSVFPAPSQQCEFSIRVDPAKGNNWLEEYTQFLDQSIDREAQDQTLNLTCNDLQEALIAISDTVFHKSNSCIEVVISRGTHYITESVEIAQNVHIQGEQAGGVSVELDVNAPTNATFFSVVTFLNADNVEISGVNLSNSPGSIAIENVTLVRVSNSSFRWFSQGALDIYQCFIVTVTNCVFEENGFVGVTKFGYQYRGHAGGLSVGFDDNHYNVNGTDSDSVPDIRGIHISGCAFRNNTSDPQESGDLVTTTQLLQDYIFPGRGGAIAITINSSFAFNASIEDCVIHNSYATSFGGGIYLGYSGYAAHTTSVNRTIFVSNRCDGPSGGLQLGFIEGGANGFTVRLEVYNSEFYDNEAEFGGAIHMFSNRSAVEDGMVQLSNVAHIKNCTFMRNSAVEYGAAICVASLLFLVDTSNVQPLSITDCTFVDNNGGRAGVLSTAYLPLAFYGQNKFYRNRGRVLVISGTRAEIHGHMHFQSNDGSAVDAGALYITSYGQLQLQNGANLVFETNTGILGASIVVVSIASLSESYSNLLYNPLCVLRSENSTDRPQDWQNVNIQFTGNKALFGSTVLLNDVNLCSWTSLGPVFFNNSEVFRWNFIDYSEDNVNRAHFPEETNPLFYVQTPAREIFLSSTHNLSAYPGESFSLNVTGIDQLGLPTSVAISLSDSQGDYKFSPSAAAPDVIQMSSISTSFTTGSHTVEEVQEFESKNITVNTIFTQSALSLMFTFTPEICPAGYVLTHRYEDSDVNHICDCNEENNPQIIQCENERIILREGEWGIQSNLTGANDSLVTYPCPPQYCQCFENSNQMCNFVFHPLLPDAQCHCSRKGELCGDCRNETAGFTALLDRCETCGYANGLVIVALLVADATVIGLLLLVKSSPPGWLYPALFYLQAVPYLSLHFPTTFEFVHPYVHYVSSALSFYFVYDFCLGPQFSAISAYFIRFIPFLVSVAVTIPVIVVRYRYNLKNKLWPGLWWVVLFQYTHVVYTCISVLNCPVLPGYDGLISPRWYINGNITCFTGFHIPLALFACVVLLFCASIIPIILLYSLGYLKRPSWLLNSIIPSGCTFKQNSSWWCALELSRRLLLVIFIIAIPRNKYPAIFCLMINICVCLFIQPFKAMSANVIEAFLAADVLILLLFRQTDYFKTLEHSFSLPMTTSNNISQYGEGCDDGIISGISLQSLLLIPGYFIPLAFFILASSVSVALNIRSYCRHRRNASSASIQSEFEDVHQESYYYRVDHQPPSTFVDISHTNHIPLSRIWSRIIGMSHSTDRANNEVEYNARQLTRQSINSLDRQKRYALSPGRHRVTKGTDSTTLTQSMPAELMNVEGYHDVVSNSYEYVELNEVTENCESFEEIISE